MHDDHGLEMIELALITALMLIAIVAAIAVIDDRIIAVFNAISNALSESGCC